MLMIIFLFLFCSYMPIWNIIDARWELQLHRPLHAAAYYLNPHCRTSKSARRPLAIIYYLCFAWFFGVAT